MTSHASDRPPARTQSHNANAPVFVWREVAWRDAFTTEMLKNTKYKAKVNLYFFVGYVDKRGKKRKKEKKKTEKRGRLSKVQRERER